MASRITASSGHTLIFGPFRLLPAQRMLLEGDKPLSLGSRALDILVALVERAGDMVSKDELMAHVWPNVFVEEGTLRVHVAALRKVLGDGQSGARYVVNIIGRGYRFVAPVTRLEEELPVRVALLPPPEAFPPLPALLTRMVGRAETVSGLVAHLPERRLVTIVGPGGIGKTTVALSVAADVSERQAFRVCFVDLGALGDPRLVPEKVALALGVAHSNDLVAALVAALRDKHMLIVLDSCEHVIEMAAALAETILGNAAGVHILATSREPLRVQGEWVHRLTPLETPPAIATLTATAALAFPAFQLFVERATASLDTFAFHDDDVPVIASICRRLDGIPLAIELAAARTDLFGVRDLAARLDDRFRLLTKGRRTALPRHRTLRATLDWSHQLLSERERVILRRLAIFPSDFDMPAAEGVAADEGIRPADVIDGVADLVAKSLITADVTGESVVYRLLDTTRAYALEKLVDSSERSAIARRHAAFYCALWSRVQAEGRPAEPMIIHSNRIEDVRAALDWCFSEEGDPAIGVCLTDVSAPLWFKLSLVGGYRERLRRALKAFETGLVSDAAREMRLNAALGLALLHTEGSGAAMTTAFSRTLELSEQLDVASSQMQALWVVWIERLHAGDYRALVALSKEFYGDDLDQPILGDRMMSLAHHLVGNHAIARDYAERVLSNPNPRAGADRDGPFQIDNRLAAYAALCRILWLQGFPDQALRTANDGVAEALLVGHALSLCYALTGACTVAFWAGDLASAQRFVAMLLEHANRHGLAYWHFWSRCFETALRHEDRASGAADLCVLTDPVADMFHLDTLATLSKDLVVPAVIARAERGDAGWCEAEILRARGELLLDQDGPGAATAAELLFRRSLAVARRQGALSWELRAAISLARLLRTERPLESYDLLASVHPRFTEGFHTTDLIEAKMLLQEFSTTTV